MSRFTYHLQLCDGPIVAFTVLHNMYCTHGLIYVTSQVKENKNTSACFGTFPFIVLIHALIFLLGYIENLPNSILIKLWQLLARTKGGLSFVYFIWIISFSCRMHCFDTDLLTWKLCCLSDSIEGHSTSSHVLRWEEFIPTYSFVSGEWIFYLVSLFQHSLKLIVL